MTTPGSPAPAREDPNQATTASFSPAQSISSYQRRSVLVHQNTPLLIATPPQVTRALAFSHPFLLPLNKFIGLISWSSGDPWESFLLVAGFWAVVQFGNAIVKWSGPLIAVAGLVAGMYGRRYSPLSTRAADETAKGHRHKHSDSSMRHQKSLDEIVETLNTFTARCNLMLNPLLELTDFLSTPQSATSASTRPALTTLFIRLVLTLPLWIALTLPPLRIITTQRVVMVVGTIFLTWHSRPARISRTILWRNLSVRYIVSVLTGLDFGSQPANVSTVESLIGRSKNQQEAALSAASTGKNGKGSKGSVRFTFTIYENQRRWLGIGWTSSMFAYERASWTDEQLNWSIGKERFQLPHVDGGAKWRWVPGSEWRTEYVGPSKDGEKGKGSGGWIYYDNKWHDPRRQDGWNRYTRRRKWYRDAELVDKATLAAEAASEPAQAAARGRAETGTSAVSSDGGTSGGPTELPAGDLAASTPTPTKPTMSQLLASGDANVSASGSDARGTNRANDDKSSDDAALLRSSTTSGESAGSRRRRGLFSRRSRSRLRRRETATAGEVRDTRSDDEQERRRSFEEQEDWLVGDDVKMGLS